MACMYDALQDIKKQLSGGRLTSSLWFSLCHGAWNGVTVKEKSLLHSVGETKHSEHECVLQANTDWTWTAR